MIEDYFGDNFRVDNYSSFLSLDERLKRARKDNWISRFVCYWEVPCNEKTPIQSIKDNIISRYPSKDYYIPSTELTESDLDRIIEIVIEGNYDKPIPEYNVYDKQNLIFEYKGCYHQIIVFVL